MPSLNPLPISESHATPALRALARERALTFRVSGLCMDPLLGADSRVEVAAGGGYWPGDVVAFRGWDDRLWVHRLVGYRLRRGRLQLLTAADSADKLDVPVDLKRVIGRVLRADGRPLPRSPVTAAAALARGARLVLAFLVNRRG